MRTYVKHFQESDVCNWNTILRVECGIVNLRETLVRISALYSSKEVHLHVLLGLKMSREVLFNIIHVRYRR